MYQCLATFLHHVMYLFYREDDIDLLLKEIEGGTQTSTTPSSGASASASASATSEVVQQVLCDGVVVYHGCVSMYMYICCSTPH